MKQPPKSGINNKTVFLDAQKLSGTNSLPAKHSQEFATSPEGMLSSRRGPAVKPAQYASHANSSLATKRSKEVAEINAARQKLTLNNFDESTKTVKQRTFVYLHHQIHELFRALRQ